MVERTPGPFHYYSEMPGHGNVTGDTIRADVLNPGLDAQTITAVSRDLGDDKKKVATDVSGMISADISLNPDNASLASAALGSSGWYAIGIMRRFAGDVDKFDVATNNCNKQYRSQLADAKRWAGKAAAETDDPNDDKKVTDAVLGPGIEKGIRDTTYKDALWALEQDAQSVETDLKKSPDEWDAIVKEMISTGLIPMSASIFFPGVTFLPSDGNLYTAWTLRNKTPEEAAKYIIDHPDKFPDEDVTYYMITLGLEHEIGEELGKRLSDPDIEFNTPEDRKDFERYAELLGVVGQNKDATAALMNETGPVGPLGAMYKIYEELNPYPAGTRPYWAGSDDPSGEAEKFEELAALFGKNSAFLISNGSMNGAIPPETGKEMFELGGPKMTVLMLNAANDNNYEFDGDFLGSMGEGVADWEGGDPLKAYSGTDGLDDINWPGYNWRDQNMDPMELLMRAADHSTQASQGFAANESLLDYMMTDRDYFELDGEKGIDHFDDILQRATIESALNPDYSEKAADISSNVIELAGREKIDNHFDDEVGGIIATYIQDADRVSRGDDPTSGSYEAEDGGVPPFGITMKKNDLALALVQVGDDETASATIADASMRLNQVRLYEGANNTLPGPLGDDNWQQGDGDPLENSIRMSSSFMGFMTDGLAQGLVEEGMDTEEARKKTAELFTMPLDLIPTDKVPVLGDYIVGQVKDQIVEGYTGNASSAANLEGENYIETQQNHLKLQSMYAMLNASTEPGQAHDPQLQPNQVEQNPDGSYGYNMGTVLNDWPTDSDGSPMTPSEVLEHHPEFASAVVQGQDRNGQTIEGLPGQVLNWTDTDWDSDQVEMDFAELYDGLD